MSTTTQRVLAKQLAERLRNRKGENVEKILQEARKSLGLGGLSNQMIITCINLLAEGKEIDHLLNPSARVLEGTLRAVYVEDDVPSNQFESDEAYYKSNFVIIKGYLDTLKSLGLTKEEALRAVNEIFPDDETSA